MAGRNYNLSMATSSSPPVVSEKKLKKICYDDDDLESDDFYDDFDKGILSPKFQLWILVVIAAAVLTAICVYFVAICRYDFQNGASTSGELVTEVAKSLDDFDYSKIERYVPRVIRNSGFISDSDAFAQFREQAKSEDYILQNTVIESDEPFDDLASLQSGLSATYGKNVNISAAKLVRVHLSFRISDEKIVNVIVNIIPIKVYHKWYLYTGEVVNYKGEPVEFLTILSDETGERETDITDISYVEKEDVSKTEEDTKPEIKLDFYEDALSDLLAGKCVINDVEHTMPDDFSSFSDLFVLDENRMQSVKTKTLKRDETLGNIPVSFTDDALVKTPVYVTLGNLSSDDVKLQDASITTLYVGAGDNPLGLLLPGNVTFGTSYADVVKMYGDLDETKDAEFRGELAESVYSLSLSNNKHNKIYFGFKDGKLVEIQWYYIDMTDYREI